jgi:ribosomal protection tetracycline resistance protein
LRTLNLGILAHVDAGKTSLTERLLHSVGVIDEIGSVDAGNTQTDSLALERQRGITIKSAVVSFVISGVTVNLIDTPGHPDFIAEVERVLTVLDGAVLVVSAVEGVQAQTRVLMRTLRRLHIPTLLFVNKIDRRGAECERVLRAVAERLTPAAVAMGRVRDEGTPAASSTPYSGADAGFTARLLEVLAEHDDALLAAYVDGPAVPYGRLRRELVRRTGEALVHPVFFGSAITGAGTDALIDGIAELLPGTEGDVDGPVSGSVFKVERGAAGEKIAYVRLFSGTLRTRDQVQVGRARAKVTAISVFDKGSAVARGEVTAGRIAKVWGLRDVRIGDPIGMPPPRQAHRYFAPPTLETVVVPRRPADRHALQAALAQLAEQDPLIGLRLDDTRHEMSVSLYGEVQKEVIQATLADEFGLDAEFRESTTICVERPIGTGTAIEYAPDPFVATVGLRIAPAPIESRVQFRSEVQIGWMPLAYFTAIEDGVRTTLQQGLYGWRVTDCTVTLTEATRIREFGVAATPAEHRNVAPLVAMAALERAGTQVCEPVHRFRLEIPTDALARTLSALPPLAAVASEQETHGPLTTVEGHLPAGNVHRLQRQLPGLTHGEGVLESAFDHYRPIRGEVPTRPRSDNNPRNRTEYLMRLRGRTSATRAIGE